MAGCGPEGLWPHSACFRRETQKIQCGGADHLRAGMPEAGALNATANAFSFQPTGSAIVRRKDLPMFQSHSIEAKSRPGGPWREVSDAYTCGLDGCGSSASETRSRPAFLARYNAESAAASSLSSVSPSRHVLTPKLTVIDSLPTRVSIVLSAIAARFHGKVLLRQQCASLDQRGQIGQVLPVLVSRRVMPAAGRLGSGGGARLRIGMRVWPSHYQGQSSAG